MSQKDDISSAKVLVVDDEPEITEIVEWISSSAAFAFATVEAFRSSCRWRRREWPHIYTRTDTLDISLTCEALLLFALVTVIRI